MSKNDDLVRRLRALAEAAQKSMDTGGREEVHPFEVQEVCEASLDAIERGAAQGTDFREMFGDHAVYAHLAAHLLRIAKTFKEGALRVGIEMAATEIAAIADETADDGGDQLQTLIEQMIGLLDGSYALVETDPDAIERGAAQGTVTDEMVERALDAFCTVNGERVFLDHSPRTAMGFRTQVRQMRAALEAVFAGSPQADVPRVEKCPTCAGTGLGFNGAGEPDTCPECRGDTVVPSPTPPAPAPDAGERGLTEDESKMLDRAWRRSGASPTPQSPAVEAEAVEPVPAGILAIDGHAYVPAAALKAKTDEIERLRWDFTEQLERAETLTSANIDLVSEQEKLLAEIERLRRERDRYRRLHQASVRAARRLRERAEAAEASNKALREGLEAFAAIADLVDSETEGFSDTDEFELMFGGHLFERFKLSTFRRARALLPETGGK